MFIQYGTCYYSNNHYGQNGNGTPFYRVGVLPKETINKMFGGMKWEKLELILMKLIRLEN